jgi:hypothetical protein
VQRCDYQQLVKEYTPRGRHSSMYISEWDLHGAAAILPRRAAKWDIIHSMYMGSTICTTSSFATGEIYRDMAFLHVYIRMGYTVQRCATTSSLCHKGNIPRTWHSPCICRMGSTRCCGLLPAACATGEIYTQGHGIPPYISEWDLRAALRLLLQPDNGIYTAFLHATTRCRH